MKTYTLFIILLGMFFLNIISTSFLIITDELIIIQLSEFFEISKINEILETKQKWTWLSYTFIPLLILIRSSLVALCLSIGQFLYNVENTFKFKQFFRIALIGEFVLVLVGFFKLGYFYFIKTDYTLEDVQQYYPLSYINILDVKNIEQWLLYPLQTINLFEVAYFFVLVYGLWKLLKNRYIKSFEMVMVNYGSGLIIWLGLVMFLTLNMS